ncbi:MAG: Na+/H+ antiporter NhaA [Microthrixaceae bacterium]|nr:Na+/H+ antiporter NhaA [Microthrixaceae bacterium]
MSSKQDFGSTNIDIIGGLALLGATVVALVWANSPWADSYASLWSTHLTIGWGSWAITEDLAHWVNDALMAIFFFVVGIEIKQELVLGQLSRVKDAMLPVAAALGGVIVPASIFFVINRGGAGQHGWGIPMATDIAFAMGLVALAGRLVPPALKVTLLALAVVDDIVAILVIALFYGSGVSIPWLAFAVVALGAVHLMKRMGVTPIPYYVVVGTIVWYATYRSGVHATIAGVAIGLLTPVETPEGHDAVITREDFEIVDETSVAQRLENRLTPFTSFVVIPLFALANAGIALNEKSLSAAASSKVAIGIFVGLAVGKVTGITGTVAILVKSGLAELPKGLTMAHIAAMGVAAGIGFTVSIFITGLAFDHPAMVVEAKTAILFASLVSALLGLAMFWLVDRRTASQPGRSKS